ncbi:Na/Pi cotransporter family protein [Salinicoccus halodurans]|uniref:Na/Pi cotransporter n=1 Tax=Salinicoccus halodurans TaxID=407035 RepID=A0A0F7HHI1_9STAP|nr:Na/Pi cotransporter family protein [Salinicoccus halodurans]AKG72946.1 Na/Pi cotransporter [Salinicoccus halodurans]SFK76532.1 phosphate:Na+ symporter [Salinicoccus halodurans]
MELSPMEVIFLFLGGLGIFLYGIKMMGDGLQAAAGDRLREILNRMTSNPLLGVLAGIIVTGLIQSSSGTTVITIGLVSAGFMTLRQAIGVIMGANIGTTITAFLIGLDIGEYSLPILALGTFMIFFLGNRPKAINLGRVLFGFGALFYGLDLMSQGVKPLANLEAFTDMMLTMSHNPILGVAVGAIMTVIVQSSSATIAILQGFYANDLLELGAALPILLGDNLGTTITAVLAALVGSIAAKRAAMVHVMFNLIGAVVFIIIMPLFVRYVEFLQGALSLNPEMTIAFAHGSFNITNTLMQLPFIFAMAWLVTKIIPGKDFSEEFQPNQLDPLLLKNSPGIALQGAQNEVKNLGNLTLSILDDAQNFSNTGDNKKYKEIKEKINVVETLQDSIKKYLIDASKYDISSEDIERQATLLEITRILYKVSIQINDYTESYNKKFKEKIEISEEAQEGLQNLYEHVYKSFKKSIDSLDIYSPQELEEVIRLSQKSYKIENKLRKQHVKRLNRGVCSTDGGLLYVDLISNLERIGYNARNISETNLDADHDELTEDFTIYE